MQTYRIRLIYSISTVIVEQPLIYGRIVRHICRCVQILPVYSAGISPVFTEGYLW